MEMQMQMQCERMLLNLPKRNMVNGPTFIWIIYLNFPQTHINLRSSIQS